MIEDGIIGLLSQSCLSIFLRVMTSFMLNFGLDSTRTGRVSKSPTDPALRQRCLEYLVGVNFSSSLAGRAPGGADPVIADRLNGGFITSKTPGLVVHDQIFGPGDSWTKMAFYVKMNSAAGVNDGIFRQWLNDKQIFASTQVPWIRPSATRDENAKWNLVAIGGNDFFQTYLNEDRREEWYSIDDLVIRTDIPDYVDSGNNVISIPPNPPAGFEVK